MGLNEELNALLAQFRQYREKFPFTSMRERSAIQLADFVAAHEHDFILISSLPSAAEAHSGAEKTTLTLHEALQEEEKIYANLMREIAEAKATRATENVPPAELGEIDKAIVMEIDAAFDASAYKAFNGSDGTRRAEMDIARLLRIIGDLTGLDL